MLLWKKMEFSEEVEMTREWFFEIFGGAGFRVTEMVDKDGKILIRRGEILEFSFCPSAADRESESRG